jgi:hypothetical protein
MLVTAELLRDGRTAGDDVLFKHTGHVYNVAEEHRDWFGPESAVVAGPHLDFSSLGAHDGYTVELCSPPPGPVSVDLPFFISGGLGWMHLTIHVE